MINDLVELRTFSGGNLNLAAPIYVMFPVACTVCSYTLLFNALSSGVLKLPISPVPEGSGESGQEASQ